MSRILLDIVGKIKENAIKLSSLVSQVIGKMMRDDTLA